MNHMTKGLVIAGLVITALQIVMNDQIWLKIEIAS